jgi:hypothetical protein
MWSAPSTPPGMTSEIEPKMKRIEIKQDMASTWSPLEMVIAISIIVLVIAAIVGANVFHLF